MNIINRLRSLFLRAVQQPPPTPYEQIRKGGYNPPPNGHRPTAAPPPPLPPPSSPEGEYDPEYQNLHPRACTILPPAMSISETLMDSSPASLSAAAFVERLLSRHTLFPLPAVCHKRALTSGFEYSWRTRDGKYLNIEFHGDGLCEWLYHDTHNNIIHAVEVHVDVHRLHPSFWKCVDMIRASVDDYMLDDDREACISMFHDLCDVCEVQ